MLRVGLIALCLACPLGLYLRANMEPVHPRSTRAFTLAAQGIGMYEHNPAWSTVSSILHPGLQDTTKASTGKGNGKSPSGPDLNSLDQAITSEDCAEQLRLLQQRVNFLERYVFELLPPPTQEQRERFQPRPLTPADVKFFMEAMQGADLPKPPDAK